MRQEFFMRQVESSEWNVSTIPPLVKPLSLLSSIPYYFYYTYLMHTYQMKLVFLGGGYWEKKISTKTLTA